jgi:hypothetical protein
MEYVFFLAFSTGLAVLARSLCNRTPKETQAQANPSGAEKLRLPRFSKSRPTELEAVAELLWFAELKHERGEFIWFDDLPTIRNGQGVECVVLVRTIHFLALLSEHEELRRRNAIVLNVPQPNA